MTITVSDTETVGSATFDGSGGFDAYDLTSTGDLIIQGLVSVQSAAVGDVIGVWTEGSSGTPTLDIAFGGWLHVISSAASGLACGFYSKSAPASFTNDGTLSVEATTGPTGGENVAAYGADLAAGGAFDNTGRLSVQSVNSSAVGLFGYAATTVTNTGEINVSSPIHAYGIQLEYDGDSLTNSGTIIAASTGGDVEGVEIFAGSTPAVASPSVVNTGTIQVSGPSGAGVNLGTGFTLTNSGWIDAQGGADGVMAAPGDGDGSGVVTIVNSGQITATGGTSPSIGIGSGATAGGYVDIANGGTITADYAIEISQDALDRGAVLRLHNTGTLNGGVFVPANSSITDSLTVGAQIFNSGHIAGDVGLIDGGSDLYDGRGGTLSGVLTLSGGANLVYLGDDGETLNTGSGLYNPSGQTIVHGGAGADTFQGGNGAVVFYVGGGNDVLNGPPPIAPGTEFVGTASFAAATSGVTVNLAVTGPQNTGFGQVSIANFENVTGSPFADHLTGDASNNVIDGGGGNDTLAGGLGTDTFVMDLAPGAATVTDFSDAQGDKIDLSRIGAFASLNDVLAASSQIGPDTVITIGSSSLRLQNVSLASLTASDFDFFAPATTVNGGSANNFTATFEGVYQQYIVWRNGAAVTGGPEGASDSLTNIQHIKFVDGYLDYSAIDPAGQVYRIYEATLGRAPDQEGLTNWVNMLNSGTSLQVVVDGFVGSQEFLSVYGTNLSNTDFVTLLYHNVLHRDPDNGGLNNWVDYLTSGQDTRAQVVLGFSESPEDIAALVAPVQQGLWVGNQDSAEVARLYDTVLGRLPDLSGLTNWTNSLESGTSLQTVANGFVGSQEFQSVYGNLSNTDFVTLLYHNVLHRGPDTIGLNNWVGDLVSGQETRAQVVLGFSDSAEHITNTAAHIDSGIWLAG